MKACRACGLPVTSIFVLDIDQDNSTVQSLQSWRDLLGYGEEPWYAFDSEIEARNTPAALASTSGTTGMPKVAVMSHYHYVAQSVQLNDSRDKAYEVCNITRMGSF